MDSNAETGPRGRRPEYRVALFGVDSRFQRMLEIVSRHARHNPFAFRVASSREPDAFDIAMVDMSVSGGPEMATTLTVLLDDRPVIKLGRRSDPRRAADDVVHDRFPRQILTALNRVAAGCLRTPAGGGAAIPPAPATRAPALAALPTLSEPIAMDRVARVAAAPTMAAFAPGLTAVSMRRNQQPCALIVDDSPTVQRQLSMALHQMGIRSEAVDCVEAALAKLLSQRFDLVFADIVMPGRDGYQFTREMRRHRTLKKLPVIILTSKSSPFDLVRAALAGCNSYLVKPVSLQSLRDTVNRQLQRSRQERREELQPTFG